MILFPAIDLYEGKAVRLFKGDYAQMTVYSNNPIEIALLNELRSASDAVDLIDCRDLPNLEGLLDNVLHLGLPLTVRQTFPP